VYDEEIEEMPEGTVQEGPVTGKLGLTCQICGAPLSHKHEGAAAHPRYCEECLQRLNEDAKPDGPVHLGHDF
jgi:hypothetical protein